MTSRRFIEFDDLMRHPLVGEEYSEINLEVLRRGQDASDLTDNSFNRLKHVCNELKIWPTDGTKVVLVCGTNGKGTTCSLIERMALETGFKPIVFSSPAILNSTECIRLNGERIEADTLLKSFCALLERFPDYNFTTFELEFLAFLQTAASVQSNFYIVEVGLGGEMDATNILPHRDAVIVTSIAFDHSDIFGDTIEKIAFAEASILRKSDQVFLGDIPNDLRPIFQDRTDQDTVEFPALSSFERKFIDTDRLKFEDAKPLLWSSTYYYANVAASVFATFGIEFANDEILEATLSAPQFGRYTRVQDIPELILDTAHNRAAVKHLVEWHNSIGQEWVPVLSIRDSRDPDDLVQPLIGNVHSICFIDALTKRCQSAHMLAERYKNEFKTIRIVGRLSDLNFLDHRAVIFGSFPGTRQLILDSDTNFIE